MEEGDVIVRRWEDLNTDVLVRIFQSFDIFELISCLAQVCRMWRLACSDPLLWKTLDLSEMKSNFIKIPLEPYVYVDDRSDKKLTWVLKVALNLSRGSILTLIFHFNLFVSNDQLTYTAQRCPRLKRLVMPGWNRLKKAGIRSAIRTWKDLESLTMPSITNPPYLMEEISIHCKNFAELKIMGRCELFFAETLTTFLPNLKVLSLRCCLIYRDALINILDGLQKLEVLNISHCLLVDTRDPPVRRVVLKELDDVILNKASRIRQFITCMDDTCHICQRTIADDGLMRWYKYEGLWKGDEVKSLAV